MASSRLSLIALGVGAYTAFAVGTFPASVAARLLAPDAVALAGVTGTVWRGSAAFGGASGLTLSDIRWRIQPVQLLIGRLSLDLDARLGDGFIRTGMTVSGSRMRFDGLRAAVSLAAVSHLLPADASGNASVELEILELVDGWPVQASGTMRLASLASQPWIPVPGITTLQFGNFIARISTGDDQVVAVVNDEGGPLELEGSARLIPDRRYRLEARVKARADASQALAQGLTFMAPATGGGYHSIALEGQL